MPKINNVKKILKIDADMHLNDTFTFSAVYSTRTFGVQSSFSHTWSHIQPIDGQRFLEKTSEFCYATGDPTSIKVWGEVKSAAIRLYAFVFM